MTMVMGDVRIDVANSRITSLVSKFSEVIGSVATFHLYAAESRRRTTISSDGGRKVMLQAEKADINRAMIIGSIYIATISNFSTKSTHSNTNNTDCHVSSDCHVINPRTVSTAAIRGYARLNALAMTIGVSDNEGEVCKGACAGLNAALVGILT